MRKILSLLVLMLCSGTLVAEDSVSVPWTEFRKLYRESIERDVMSRQTSVPAKDKPQVHTIEEAVYRIKLGRQSAQGEVLMSGRIVSGKPEPIEIFDNDVVISGTRQVKGGAFVSGADMLGGVMFLPDGRSTEFQFATSFLVRPREDDRSRIVLISTIPALKSSLHLDVPEGMTVVGEPGIADKDGVYHFASGCQLEIRFRDTRGVAAASVVDIDTLSSIRFQGRRVILSTAFIPAQTVPESMTLRMQEGIQYISSSLKGSWIARDDDGSYRLRLPRGYHEQFTMQFSLPEPAGEGGLSMSMPRIEGNNGREGDFVLDEPDDGKVSVSGKGLVSALPATKLKEGFTAHLGKHRSYLHIPADESISVGIDRFKTVATPAIVLDSQYFYTSFEDNGNVLSVLVMDVPAEMGPRLRLDAVPDTEIWSLTVNGSRRKVYSDDESSWIVPLDEGAGSHVELALLRKGSKLGLRGRIEAGVPATGLPSRKVYVGIAMPERVQLLSLEGPVSPSKFKLRNEPAEFVGNAHYFSRDFYKGEGMKLAIYYEEPREKNETSQVKH